MIIAQASDFRLWITRLPCAKFAPKNFMQTNEQNNSTAPTDVGASSIPNQSDHLPPQPNISESFRTIPQGSENFRNVPHDAEGYGKLPKDSERFGTFPHFSERRE